MTRHILLAAVAAVAAVTLTACGGEGASNAGPSASSTASKTAPATASTVETTAPGAETPAPDVETTAPATKSTTSSAAPLPSDTPSADQPCAVVTREYLITSLRMTGTPKYPMADLQNARCSGTYASAMSHPEGTLHPVMYLFQYSSRNGHMGWYVIDVGEGLDCVNRHGVPAAAGRAIGCAA
ncbi:hypothetical protein [Nocardia sp. XZ_19_385]|uniref:hypothetical protein n=1 Tax=Nocardia sp. XZ_19_385 TaxID=2769488 RepID=UPI00188F0378|nr:hypothetical protein [Nocardia sp. XZ_19_385]